MTHDQPNVELLLEEQNGLLEANLEASMRIYDAILALIGLVAESRVPVDELRMQHAEGLYYFPPFAVADNDSVGADESYEPPSE